MKLILVDEDGKILNAPPPIVYVYPEGYDFGWGMILRRDKSSAEIFCRHCGKTKFFSKKRVGSLSQYKSCGCRQHLKTTKPGSKK